MLKLQTFCKNLSFMHSMLIWCSYFFVLNDEILWPRNLNVCSVLVVDILCRTANLYSSDANLDKISFDIDSDFHSTYIAARLFMLVNFIDSYSLTYVKFCTSNLLLRIFSFFPSSVCLM